MPEEPQGGAGKEGGEGGGGDAGGSSTDPKTGAGRGPDGQPWDPDRAMRTIETLREEARAAKDAVRERDELKAKVEEFEKANLNATEKLQRERDEATARAEAAEKMIADRGLTDAIVAAATEAGSKSGRAEAVARLVDRSAVQTNGDGKPSNLKDLVEKVRAEAPELFEAQVPTGDAEGGPRTTGPTEDMNSRIRRMAGRPT